MKSGIENNVPRISQIEIFKSYRSLQGGFETYNHLEKKNATSGA